MNETVNVVCASCAAVNRIPTSRLHDGPICGKCRQPLLSGQPPELSDAVFTTYISRNDLPVVVDFWAPWCGPCRMMAPEFAKAATRMAPEIILAKLNTEGAKQTAAQFRISGIPTMIAFRNGREVARTSGAMNAEQIERWISTV